MEKIKTFSEIEASLLEEHGKEYKAFTRLLLTLSVAGFTFLTAFQKNYSSLNMEYSFFALISFVGLFLSSFFGVIVQHQIMMSPLNRVNRAKKLSEEAVKNQDENQSIKLYARPSILQRIFYKLQVSFFLFSFLCLLLYTFTNISQIFNIK